MYPPLPKITMIFNYFLNCFRLLNFVLINKYNPLTI